MSDVFLSYAREDEEFAHRVVAALEKENIRIWWDKKIPARVNWMEYLEKRILKSKVTLVIWSEHSKKSKFVREEVNLAVQHEKLVQVLINGCQPPFGLATEQAPDLTDWMGQPDQLEWLTTVEAVKLLIRGGRRDSISINMGGKGNARNQPNIRHAQAIHPGRRFRDLPYTPTLVAIGTGSFTMGDINGSGLPSEQPLRRVNIIRPFAIGVRPVTFSEWDAAVKAGVSLPRLDDKGWGRENRPAICVSWEDANRYVQWLSQHTGRRYRLPSEAEWEYCARAGSSLDFAFGRDLTRDEANIDSNRTTPVGCYQGNAFGLYDMHGNVWEWVADFWYDNYNGAPSGGEPRQSGSSDKRVLRGGSWRYSQFEARASHRATDHCARRSSNYGFRIARDI